MTKQTEKTPFAIEPLTKSFGYIPLMKALKKYGAFETLLEARQFVYDLDLIAPQVVYVATKRQKEFQNALADLDLMTEAISESRAKTIATENKPIYGTVKVHIRMRDNQINQIITDELKAKKLISHYRKGNNADDIYHWKDDRWYQDYYLFAYQTSDLPEIENIIESNSYIIVNEP